ncbi:relaxase domain-containing protein, partial [Streptomyces sp. LN549]|uniref:relaxase domain-containing protein n=1 Tax=Streptomyces sp. LN549 TaxID=3112979 RepID=UPI00371CB569
TARTASARSGRPAARSRLASATTRHAPVCRRFRDHVPLSVKGSAWTGKWGSVHSEVAENTVAASALYNEIVAAEVREDAGPAGRAARGGAPGGVRSLDIAGVPHELIRWTASRGEQIDARLADLEYEYVTAVDDEARAEVPARGLRAGSGGRTDAAGLPQDPGRPSRRRPPATAQLRAEWKQSAIDTSKVAADVTDSLLERARRRSRRDPGPAGRRRGRRRPGGRRRRRWW